MNKEAEKVLNYRASIDMQDMEQQLFDAVKSRYEKFEELLEKMDDDWMGPESVYRFYHHSYKVCYAVSHVKTMVALLKSLLPEDALMNPMFTQIVEDGNKGFNHEMSVDWLGNTRPIVEAYFHARHMVQVVASSGRRFAEEEYEKPPQMLDYDWATVLYLFNLR